jgi:hypothetical protein
MIRLITRGRRAGAAGAIPLASRAADSPAASCETPQGQIKQPRQRDLGLAGLFKFGMGRPPQSHRPWPAASAGRKQRDQKTNSPRQRDLGLAGAVRRMGISDAIQHKTESALRH